MSHVKSEQLQTYLKEKSLFTKGGLTRFLTIIRADTVSVFTAVAIENSLLKFFTTILADEARCKYSRNLVFLLIF